MANKALSLEVSAALVNDLDVLEQMQRFALMFENTTVDARGIADRYPNAQAVKQKQSVAQTFHWYNSTTELEAYNCDISLWDIASSKHRAGDKRNRGDFRVHAAFRDAGYGHV
jgi:hypothetical protein